MNRALSDRSMRRLSVSCLVVCGLLFLIGSAIRPADAQGSSAADGCSGAKAAPVAHMAVVPASPTQ